MNKYIVIFAYILFIFSGLFKWIAIGVDITILAFTIMLAVGIPYFKLNINRKLSLPIILVLGLSVLVVISISYTEASPEVWGKKLLGYALGLVSFIYPFIIPSVFNDSKRFLVIARVFFYVGLSYILFQFVSDGFRFLLESPSEKFPNYLAISTFLGMGVLANFDAPNRLMRFGGSIAGIAMMIALGGRGPVLFFVSILLLRYLYIFNRNRILVISLLGLVIPLFFFLDLSNYSLFDRLIRRYSLLFDSFTDGTSKRVKHLTHSLDQIEEHPITGLGLGGYGKSFYNFDIFSYPHNIFLEVGSEVGLIAMSLLLLLIWSSVKFVLKKRLSSSTHLIWLIFIFFFLNSMKSGGLDSFRVFICWLSVLLMVSLTEQRETQ